MSKCCKNHLLPFTPSSAIFGFMSNDLPPSKSSILTPFFAQAFLKVPAIFLDDKIKGAAKTSASSLSTLLLGATRICAALKRLAPPA